MEESWSLQIAHSASRGACWISGLYLLKRSDCMWIKKNQKKWSALWSVSRRIRFIPLCCSLHFTAFSIYFSQGSLKPTGSIHSIGEYFNSQAVGIFFILMSGLILISCAGMSARYALLILTGLLMAVWSMFTVAFVLSPPPNTVWISAIMTYLSFNLARRVWLWALRTLQCLPCRSSACWVYGERISYLPGQKREEAIQKRIETIMVGLEKDIDRKIKQLEWLWGSVFQVEWRNRGLRAEIKRYKQMLKDVQKGGE